MTPQTALASSDAASAKSTKQVHLDSAQLVLESNSALDRVLKRFVINPILNYGFNPRVIDFFKWASRNPIIRNLNDGPGSWKSMLAHYESPRGFFDRLLNRFISFPRALRNRSKLVVDALSQLMESYGKEAPLHLVGIGSGSGSNLLAAAEKTRSKIQSMEAQLFDLNEEALKFGHQKSCKMGFQNEIRFVHCEANEVESKIAKPPQIVEMIGLIEYLSDPQIIRLFDSVRRFRHPSSSLVISSMEDRHGIRRFLDRTLDFRIEHRSPRKLVQLLSEFGYKNFNIFPEPLGLFNVIVGHV